MAWLRRNAADPVALAEALRARLSAPPGTGADDLRRRLASCVAADFAGGDVVEVEGWVLARTEVRLAALAALVFAV